MKAKFANKLYDYQTKKDKIYKDYKILASTYIIDENQSVKWNREEVQKINEKNREDLIKAQKECAEFYNQILDEIFIYYKEEYPEILRSFAQFKYLWERAVDEELCYGYHSVMEELERLLDDFEEFKKLGDE